MSFHLLGANFLQANFLLVDLKGKRLVDTAAYLYVPLHQAPVYVPHFDATLTFTDHYDILLKDARHYSS